MQARRLMPILNVSSLEESFAWFERLGWRKSWDWGSPANFGSVCSGQCEIFLCLNGQGGRGRTDLSGASSDESAGQGMWVSVWVDDVDVVYRHCVAQGIEVTRPPTDMPWNAREMQVRHPDGHVFRIGRSFEETEEE